jgi:hypothetical protein
MACNRDIFTLGYIELAEDSSNLFKYFGFQVLTARTIRSIVFRDVTSSSSYIDGRFGVKYRLPLQGRRVSQARNEEKGWFNFLSLLSDNEDGGEVFLRNVYCISSTLSHLPLSGRSQTVIIV